jgi:hypothetical protein
MLRHAQPVVWAPDKRAMILFAPDYTSYVTEDWFGRQSPHADRVVILYDGMAGEISTGIYSGMARMHPCHLVLATSPPINKFKRWLKGKVDCMTMNYFTRDEVIYLA